MAKHPKISPKDMTNDELRDRFITLQKRVGAFNRKMPWIAGGIALAAVALAATLAILGIAGATAAVGIAATGLSAAGSGVGLGALIRDTSWQDEATSLQNENNMRVKLATVRQERAAAEEARKLREEFDAAISAVSEGRGIDGDLKLRKPLRLNSKSLFRIFSA
jgi:hypothetical protein